MEAHGSMQGRKQGTDLVLDALRGLGLGLPRGQGAWQPQPLVNHLSSGEPCSSCVPRRGEINGLSSGVPRSVLSSLYAKTGQPKGDSSQRFCVLVPLQKGNRLSLEEPHCGRPPRRAIAGSDREGLGGLRGNKQNGGGCSCWPAHKEGEEEDRC